MNHSSVYRISGRQSSWEAYDKELRRFGIFVKARNSLVFQVCFPPVLPNRQGFDQGFLSSVLGPGDLMLNDEGCL